MSSIRTLTTVLLSLACALGRARPAEAQGGFRLGVAAGVAGSLTEEAPTSPAGIGFEINPEWRTAGGFGIGLGFRYLNYSDVPNHGAVYLDVRKVWQKGPGVHPVLGLRLGAFAGGDRGGDDPFIGLQAGPVAGVEVPVSPRTSISVLGSGLAMAPLFRGLGFHPALFVGVVIR